MSPHKPTSDPHTPDFPAALRAANLRVTAIRLALLDLLQHARQPLAAQQIFDDLTAKRKPREPKPDRVTVYRTLNSLVDAGLAHKVDPGDRVFRFSLTDHAHCTTEYHVHEHPHFVCDTCGTVECLEEEQVVVKRRTPTPKGEHASKRRVRQEGVVLHGTCETCVDEPPRT
jgi:Fur family ferric uptake transcriptional regulator